MKAYVKKNLIPIVWQAAFIISCFIVPGRYFIYTNFVFYLGILLYFLGLKEVSFKSWKENILSGKKFWKAVILTTVFFLAAFVLTSCIEGMFPNLDTGSINLRRSTWLELLIFAVSTIILPPLAEEMFYRSSMICLKSKKLMVLTTILSMFLYAAEHALTPFGIALTMIWAIPLSVAYIKTKNIYVPMTAHFIMNLLGNGADVVITAINWM